VYEPESYATSDVVLVSTNTNTKHLRRVAEEDKEEAAIPKCKRSQVLEMLNGVQEEEEYKKLLTNSSVTFKRSI
jgi:aspartate-semialdehyde dehydrogenase